MSDVEALMWALEDDPHLSANFANVSFLDRAPDPDRLRRRLWHASRTVPLLRRRVVAAPRPQTPRWELDEDFDIDRHLRRVVLPTGAGDEDVLALATEIAATRFPADRPLWEFTVVEGLPGGRAAMVQKLHHTITDGEGGIRMSLAFIDLERDAPGPDLGDDVPPDPVTHEPGPANGAASTRPRRPDDLVRFAPLDLLGALTRRGVDAAGDLAGDLTGALRDPAGFAAAVAALPAESAAIARSLLRQVGSVDRFRSPLWTERSLGRALDVFDVPLADVKAAGRRHGASINDVFVAAAAGGAGRYHRDRGVEVGELRISMPVSTRTDRSAGGNAFAPTRVLVPTQADPRARLVEIHERLTRTKGERALDVAGTLAGLTNFLPPPVLIRAARQQVATVDFAASNVRAAPFDLFIGGARMTGNYPVGPLGGTAWNITTMSYRGQLNVGIHSDTAAVEDPDALAAAVRSSFEDLLDLD
jgi:WS/DGAT/MGAT family acyltransferase